MQVWWSRFCATELAFLIETKRTGILRCIDEPQLNTHRSSGWNTEGERIPAAGCRSTRQNKSERWKELKQITWMEEKEWFRTQGEEESYETKKRIKTIHAMCESLSSPGAFCSTYHTDDKALKLPAYFWPQVSPKGHGYDWRHPENCHLTVTQCSRRSTSALLCWRPTQRRRWTRRNIRTYL